MTFKNIWILIKVAASSAVGTYHVNLRDIGKKSDLSYSVGAGTELILGKVGIFGELRYIDFKVDLDNRS